MESTHGLAALLAELENRGIKLRAEGDRLRYTAPPGALSPELRAQLQERKAKLISALRGDIPGATPATKTYPASETQRRFLTLQRLNPEEAFYNAPFVFQLEGPVDAGILCQSFHAVAARHESLRTTLQEIEGQLVQVVAPAGEINPPVQFVTASESVKSLLNAAIKKPFDLAREPGLRALLLRTGSERFILQLCFHNTLFDQSSLLVLLEEVSLHYTALVNGSGPPDLPLAAQYAEYVRWRESCMEEGSEERLRYWREWFREGPPPASNWIPARQPPSVPSFDTHVTWLRCSPALTKRLKELSKRHGVTLYIAALTAYALILSRYTGCSDVTFGTTYSNRDHWRFANMIGATIQVPALRIDLASAAKYDALLVRIRDVVAGALTWQDVPLEKIAPALGLALRPGPLFRAVVSYFAETPHGKLRLPGIAVTFLEEEINESSRPDLYLVLWENETPEGGVLTGYWMHKRDVFDAETAARMSGEFVGLLSSMADTL